MEPHCSKNSVTYPSLDRTSARPSARLSVRTTGKPKLYHVDISKRFFFVCQLKIVFYFLHELKQRSSDVTGRHLRLVDSDITSIGSKNDSK